MFNHLKKAKIVLNNLGRYFIKKSALINLNIIATNLCNQHCPMCNTTLMRDQRNTFTLDIFNKYLEKLKYYNLASCTISGGEATLVKELPEIIEKASKHFPFGVLLITNLYGNTNQLMKVVESAFKNHVNLSISFDGYGDVADLLRGSKNVSVSIEKNISLVNKLKNSMETKSKITLHTVINDHNLPQIPQIFDYSKKLGWEHTIAPVNFFYYQKNTAILPSLTFSQQLLDVCELALAEKHVKMMDSYIKGILLYANGKAPKLCPYLKNYLKTYKFFLEPNGDLSLCDRVSIGNINEQHIDEMIKSSQYENSASAFRECKGCWLGCFVEPGLRIQASNRKIIPQLYEEEKSKLESSNKRHIPQLEDQIMDIKAFSNSEKKGHEKPIVQVGKKD